MPTAADYLYQTIHLLGQADERRAIPELGRIVRDSTRPERIRGVAAMDLGWFRAGLDDLLIAAGDLSEKINMITNTFRSIRQINDPNAIEAVRRIAQSPAPPAFDLDAVDAHKAAIMSAELTLRILGGEIRPPGAR